jgi:hypothetical protein
MKIRKTYDFMKNLEPRADRKEQCASALIELFFSACDPWRQIK